MSQLDTDDKYRPELGRVQFFFNSNNEDRYQSGLIAGMTWEAVGSWSKGAVSEPTRVAAMRSLSDPQSLVRSCRERQTNGVFVESLLKLVLAGLGGAGLQ